MRNTLLVTTLFAGAIFANNARAEDVEITQLVRGIGSGTCIYDCTVSCDANGCTKGSYSGYVENGTFYITSAGSSDKYSYNTNGLVTQRIYYEDGSIALTENYSYEGNTRTIVRQSSIYDSSTEITTFKNNITSLSDVSDNNLVYDITNDQFGNTRTKLTIEDNGEVTDFAEARFSTNGKLSSFDASNLSTGGSFYFDDNGNLTTSYFWHEDDYADYRYNYDDTTGKPLSKICGNCYINGEWIEDTVVETYDFTTDGKLKVCDANGANCTTTEYSSLEDYSLAPYGDYLDVFDSDFGTVGYVPSRLKANETIEKNNDGSYTIRDANGKIIGYKGKRIYTIQEANNVAGKKNTVTIRYK